MSNIKRNPDILWRSSGGDVLLFSLESGSLWRINRSGARIWNLLDGSHSVTEISKIIFNENPNVDEKRIKNGLNNFLEMLREREMIYEE
jgi:hypothetical protein